MKENNSLKRGIALAAFYAVSIARFADEKAGAGGSAQGGEGGSGNAGGAAGSGNAGGDGGSGTGAGASGNAGAAGSGEGGSEGDGKKDPAYWEKQAKEHANEARNLRTRLKDAETKVEQFEAANKTELEKATDKATKAETELANARKLVIESKVEARAAGLGFADPGDAIRFIDASKIDETFSNVDELLKGVLESKPYLKKSSGTGSPGTPSGNPQGSTEGNSQAAKTQKVIDQFPGIGRLVAQRTGK